MFLIGNDYRLESPLTFNIPAMDSSGVFCVNMRILDDSVVEGVEQFQLYFEENQNDSAIVGDPKSLCVNIMEDGMD